MQVDPDRSDLSRVTELFLQHWKTLEGESHTRLRPLARQSPDSTHLPFPLPPAPLRRSARLEHLQKEGFDNVAAYLQKKQQRLQGQQQKRAGPQSANGVKKAKTADAAQSDVH